MQGKIFFALIVSVLLAGLAARWLSRLYRRRIMKLMSGGAAPAENLLASYALPAGTDQTEPRQFTESSLGANRASRRRLAVVLIVLSLLMGISVAWFLLMFVYHEGGFGPVKLLIMGAIYAAPIVPVLGMLWRWSWMRVVAAACGYLSFCVLIVALRSTEQQSYSGVVMWLAGQIGLPLAAVLILTGSGKARAAAPYLFLPFLVLTTASILGLDALEGSMESEYSGAIAALAGWFGAHLTFILFAVVPWIIAFWPVRSLSRWLAMRYRKQAFSEVTYLFGGYWLLSLLFYALPPFHVLGFGTFGVLSAWLWIPIGFRIARPLLVRQGPAPVLLVLRVFRRDAEVEELFDRTIERWRASGSAVLIAGSDLVSRTMNPDDLFAFIQGSLANRFVRDEETLRQQLASIETRPDHDGRYRVSDFYCFDTTWQAVLVALVGRADRVLMDLRGLTAQNRGCLFELETLANAKHIKRIVLLNDSVTDRAAAESALGSGDDVADRIIWEDVKQMTSAKAEKLLGYLLT